MWNQFFVNATQRRNTNSLTYDNAGWIDITYKYFYVIVDPSIIIILVYNQKVRSPSLTIKSNKWRFFSLYLIRLDYLFVVLYMRKLYWVLNAILLCEVFCLTEAICCCFRFSSRMKMHINKIITGDDIVVVVGLAWWWVNLSLSLFKIYYL